MKDKVITALKIVAQFLIVAAMFLMIYAALWLGYYAGIPM